MPAQARAFFLSHRYARPFPLRPCLSSGTARVFDAFLGSNPKTAKNIARLPKKGATAFAEFKSLPAEQETGQRTYDGAGIGTIYRGKRRELVKMAGVGLRNLLAGIFLATILFAQATPPGGRAGGLGNHDSTTSTVPDYGTNLWLSINLSNDVVHLLAGTTVEFLALDRICPTL